MVPLESIIEDKLNLNDPYDGLREHPSVDFCYADRNVTVKS